MVEHRVKLKQNFYAQLTEKDQHKVCVEIGEQIKKFFIEQIREVYLINSRIRDKQNYIPMEDICAAITVDFKPKEDSLCISIDTDNLQYRDNDNNPIFEVSEKKEQYKEYGGPINNFEDHWHTPIQGMQEIDWAVNKTVEKSTQFIQQYYTQITKKYRRVNK